MRSSYGPELSIKSLSSGGGSSGGAGVTIAGGGGGSSSFSSAIHDSVKKTITDSISKNSLGEVSGGVANSNDPRMGKIASAYKLIMQNKKFKNSVSLTSSKTKSGNII